jgi:STE24 endopeptidase
LKRASVVALSPDVLRVVDSIYAPARQALAARLAALEIALFFAGSALQLVILFVGYASGAWAALRAALEKRIRRPLALTAVFVVLAFAIYVVLLLPFSWFAGFTVPHAFGLSRENPATWYHDWFVGNVVSVVVLVVLAALYGVAVRRFGNAWPVVVAVALAPIIVVANAIYPAFIAPLFNSYQPLPSSPLTRSILSLAQSQGISASAVYEYDMSRQTTESDAYVSGLGPTARIAVGDNLLANFKPDETLYIVAHEMGHYKLHHIWWGSLYGWLGAIVATVFVWLVGGWMLRASPRHARAFDDPAALPMLAAVLLVFALLGMPAANAVSRSIEHAADAFAAAHTRLDGAGVRAFARIGSEDLSVLHPSPFVVWYFYTHPPLDERIEYAADNAR